MNSLKKIKKLIKPLREAMYNFTEQEVRNQLNLLISQDAIIQLCYPLNNQDLRMTLHHSKKIRIPLKLLLLDRYLIVLF